MMGMDDVTPRIEAARHVADQARMYAQDAHDALDGLEGVDREAAIARLAAEGRRRIAEAALLAAEAARDAAEVAQLAAEAALGVVEVAQAGAESSRAVAEAAQAVAEIGRAGAEDAAREAELARRHLQEFLAMAAHDISGPLTLIAGYTDLLAAPVTSPDERDALVEGIRVATLQVTRLVEDVMDAGRVGAGEFRLRPEPLDLVALVRRVAGGQQTTSDRHRIVVDAPERLDGEWDPVRLGQVMVNLVSNAIKYSPDGGEVRIDVGREGDAALVRVADRGRGIRAADVRLLFRPFARLLRPEERGEVAGAGLGLYISHGIVLAHGGSIRAESEGPGAGSEFSVRLPLRARA